MSGWDRRGSGSREYDDQEYARVVRTMRERHVGEAFRCTSEDLAAETSVQGRTLRAILSEADGREFVLAQGDDGMFVATSQEEAEPGTRRLASQARRMAERAERRAQLAEELPKLQAELF